MKFISVRKSESGRCILDYENNKGHHYRVFELECDDVEKFKKCNDDNCRQAIIDKGINNMPVNN